MRPAQWTEVEVAGSSSSSCTSLETSGALRLAGDESVDAILLDFGLPDVSGYEVCVCDQYFEVQNSIAMGLRCLRLFEAVFYRTYASADACKGISLALITPIPHTRYKSKLE
jgi:hypothetical protein